MISNVSLMPLTTAELPRFNRRSFLSRTGAVALATAGAASASDEHLKLPSSESIRTGGVRMIDFGSDWRVWTKKIGSGSCKVLLLHDGPGAVHCIGSKHLRC